MKNTCFISGKFNVVHPGHLRLFRHAKEIAARLVIGVYSDSYKLAGDILVSEQERLEGVRANLWVDDVVLVRNLPESIRQLQPDVVLKGKEHESSYNLEKAVTAEYGGVLRFAGGGTRLSSSALMRAEANVDTTPLAKSNDFLERHGITKIQLSELLEAMTEVRTIVVGDLIVDRYIDCEPVGLSAEDPTVVVSPLVKKSFVGGAGIVAAHAASLGANSSLVSIRGDDEPGEDAVVQLQSLGVNTKVLVDPDRPTTRKSRYRASDKTLLRVNEVRDHQIDQSLADSAYDCFVESLSGADLVIFSDFSYGMLTDDLIERITHDSRAKGITLAADSQSSSQIGDITRFPNVTLLTPTEREARLAVRDNKSGLVGISEKIRQATNAEFIPITLASEGVFLHRPEEEGRGWTDDQVPTLNDNPVDVSGAGDAFLVSAAMCLAKGADIWSAIFLGSLGAACQVSRVGNVPLLKRELVHRLGY